MAEMGHRVSLWDLSMSVGEMREDFWGGFCANQLRISGKIPSESLIA
jgi:hypothetical protein